MSFWRLFGFAVLDSVRLVAFIRFGGDDCCWFCKANVAAESRDEENVTDQNGERDVTGPGWIHNGQMIGDEVGATDVHVDKRPFHLQSCGGDAANVEQIMRMADVIEFARQDALGQVRGVAETGQPRHKHLR